MSWVNFAQLTWSVFWFDRKFSVHLSVCIFGSGFSFWPACGILSSPTKRKYTLMQHKEPLQWTELLQLELN